MARKITVEIIGNSSSLERSFGKAKASASGLTGSLGKLSIGLGQLAKGVLVVDAVQKALEGLHETLHLATEEFSDNAKVTAQTQAVLKSTGGIANVTAKHIDELGLSLSNLSGIDDEAVRAGENVLLSFTNIRDFAGKNNDIFTQATKAVTDYAARTGKDLPASALIIGRALEDPARRATSLSRAGIVLSGAQLKALQAVEKSQGILAAQKVLIKDLKDRFEGAAVAAGQTLPGALNILKDRFKDLVGGGISLIQPGLKNAAVALSAFVVQLTEAKGFHAKFDVAVTGIENLGKQIEEQARRIDVRGIASAVGARLRSINWPRVISTAGHDVGVALVASLNKIASVIGSVNWTAVGKQIVHGLALAVGAAIKFLASVDWAAVAKAAFRLINAAFKAQAQILLGAGKEIGNLIVEGIRAGLAAGGNALERFAVNITLKIVEPFTHLPGFLGGGPFQRLKETLKQTLADMAVDGASGGKNVGASITAGIQAGLASGSITVGPHSSPVKLKALDIGTTPAVSSALPQPPAPPVVFRTGITASQRNTFFDNAISRALLREGLLTDLKAQLGALAQVSSLLSARLAKTKDVTRRLNLEDQILQIAAQEQGLRQQIGQQFLDSLSFGVTKAQATAGLKDDLAALNALQAGIQQRIKAEGKTADLTQQLFDVRQQIKTARQQQTDARQFFTLGLDATGAARVPLVKTLQKQLANVSNAVAGTFLDTNKTRSVLENIKKVLSAGIGNVSSTVRAQIQQMLDGINQQLKDHAGDVTKFSHVNSAALLKGLGLSPEQIRDLRLRVAQIGVGGTVPGGRSQAFALAGAGPTYVLNNPQFHGVNDIRALETELAKRARSRPQVRRGAR